MSLGATLGASFLITLARPATWVLALAAFLIRGGIVLVLAPIVVIPSAVGLANAMGPWITSFVFGGWTPEVTAALVVAGTAVLAWLLGGGLLAAAAEAEMTRLVAEDEELGEARAPERPRSGTHAWRIVAARLLAHLPTLLALAWGGARVAAATYRELTLPSEVGSPLVLRVVTAVPEALAVILVAWLLGEALGSVAARRVVLHGDGPLRALGGAIGRMIRHPLRILVLMVAPLVGIVAVVVPSTAAAATTWTAVRSALTTDAGPLPTLLLLLAFVGLWLGGIALLALVSAWRAAVWTVDAVGTFGVPDPVRAGDWQGDGRSGTLTDLRPRGVDPDSR